jgi:hypothetical protein
MESPWLGILRAIRPRVLASQARAGKTFIIGAGLGERSAASRVMKKAEQRLLRARLRIGAVCLQHLTEAAPGGSGRSKPFQQWTDIRNGLLALRVKI